MHQLLALLMLASPAPAPTDEARAVIVKGLDQFDANVEKLAGFIRTRFSVDSDEPRTGLAVESGDRDATGLHPIFVTTVLRGSPADVAGVRPGDRILSVGPRRIEHETAQVFRVITDGAAGPLELTVLRRGRTLKLTVNRAPIACLQRSSARIDREKWQSRLADLRKLSGMVRAELDDETVTPVEMRLRASNTHLAQLFGLFDEFSKMLSAELTDAMAKECLFRTLP